MDLAVYAKPVQSEPGSFSWSEDFDESMNFWFWLRRTEGIDDAALLERLQQWLMKAPFPYHSARRPRLNGTSRLVITSGGVSTYPLGRLGRGPSSNSMWGSYTHQKPAHARAYYKSMVALGVRLRVQWVMAPFGERWLLPPDLAVMGVEGGTAESRRKGVLQAARALASSSAAS
jgi:hypothetical protein